MHEISLIRTIISTLEEEFPGRSEQIRGIHLKVGLLSNIQPILMHNAFDAVRLDEPRYSRASLHVEVLPVQIYCGTCDLISEIENYRFCCHRCGRPMTKLVQGEELLISQVEFDS
jgi:hydrogenase nickel incorporation protein HypA/HybF